MPSRHSRFRLFRSSVFVLAICLLVGGLLTRSQARVIGRGAEISIGRETASVVERFFVVDTDPVAVARVRGIGRRLVSVSRDPNYPFEFHVVESPEVNAFALPGGFIYIFRGLLQVSPNDDALAFVIAHEISHVTERHAIKQFEKNLLLNAGISAILAGTGARGWGRAADVVSAIVGAKFSRGDESDADEHGIDLLVRAGYNPRSAVDAMALVKRSAGDGGIPALFRSHPAPESRMRRLSEWADQLLEQRQVERDASPTLPPAPKWVVRRLPGLDSIEVAPCEWWPLRTGDRWSYRVTSGQARTTLDVRVLEELNADPEGVWRVEYAYGRELRSVRWVAPAGDRIAVRPESSTASDWRIDALFAERDVIRAESGTTHGEPGGRVKVPAGEYDTWKVVKRDSAGSVTVTEWYARGVGLVRREASSGAVIELLRHRPDLGL